jgi:chorismate mutase/prephenate dehydratase
MASIDDLRKDIDRIDKEIVSLLDERAGVAKAIGAVKEQEGRKRFYDASRQKLVIKKAIDSGSGSFPPEAIRNVFVEIMSASLALERAPTVGYLGPEATFSHQASLLEFGSSVVHRPFNSVYDIFFAVDRDWVDYGIIPIENSTGGVIHLHLDMFLSFNTLICSEINLAIHQNLISRNQLDKIRVIYSKIQPFQQCQMWLKENLPSVQLIEVGATTRGVEMAQERDYAAAIGSVLAARKYNMPVLAPNIEDLKDNTTRFVVIGKQKSLPTGNDKTSIMVSIKDEPGALYELLRPFHERKINLTKIESRPTRVRAWELVFFIDLLGHQEDPAVADCLEILRQNTVNVKIMGSYPRDIDIHSEADVVEVE